MRTLTDGERMALRPVGMPGASALPDNVFDELEALGWGTWQDSGDGLHEDWIVTPEGRRAFELDELARSHAER